MSSTAEATLTFKSGTCVLASLPQDQAVTLKMLAEDPLGPTKGSLAEMVPDATNQACTADQIHWWKRQNGITRHRAGVKGRCSRTQ